jgi:hypothetical protein
VILLVLAALFVFGGLALSPVGDSDEEVAEALPLVCEPGIPVLPCAAGVEAGVPYAMTLLTHCELEWAYFDGRYWVPPAPVSRPGGWGNLADGLMTLAARDEAVFVPGSGPEVRFRPAADDYRPQPCA